MRMQQGSVGATCARGKGRVGVGENTADYHCEAADATALMNAGLFPFFEAVKYSTGDAATLTGQRRKLTDP